jgi:outer membrane scaffolding protein for murein synthesis (MipA/OmpV family)
MSSLCLCLLSYLAPESLPAQTLQEQEIEQTGLSQNGSKGWNAILGTAVVTSNTYEGAQSYRVRPAPFLLISYHNELFLGPLGLAWKAIDWNGFHAGPVLGLLGGRRQDLDARLNGLGDIPSSLAAGVFAEYSVKQLQLSANFREAVTHTGNGWLGLVQLDYRMTVILQRLVFFIGPEIELASRKYEQTFFGVTATQSLDSGLPVFTPAGGYKDYGIHTGLTYVCTRHFIVRVFADERWLGNDISGSPIVQRNTQTLFGIGAAYHF